jgi:hypothetical protein
VNILLSLGCFLEARKLWRLFAGYERRVTVWVASCAFFAALLPFLDCMQSGQLGIGILYLLMLGSRLVIQGRSPTIWLLGGMLLALPAVVKLVPSLPVAFLCFQRWSAVVKPRSGQRPWGQAAALTAGLSAGCFLFVLAIPAALVGWRENLNYLEQWHARVVTNERVGTDKNFNIHSYRNQSLANAAYLWGQFTAPGSEPRRPGSYMLDHPERVVHAEVRILIGLILTALLVAGVLLGRQNHALDQATAFGLACCATLLVSPLSWGHYYMVQLPAALLGPLWLLRRGRPVQARLVAVIPPFLTWSHYVAMPYLGELGLLGLGTTAWFLGLCLLIVADETLSAFHRSGSVRQEPEAASQHKVHFAKPVHVGS